MLRDDNHDNYDVKKHENVHGTIDGFLLLTLSKVDKFLHLRKIPKLLTTFYF